MAAALWLLNVGRNLSPLFDKTFADPENARRITHLQSGGRVKKKLTGTAILLLTSVLMSAQSDMKKDKNGATEQSIQQMEQSLWQAWKNHDAKPFGEHLTDTSLNVNSSVYRGRAAIVKDATSSNCTVNNFSLSDFAYTWIDPTSVIVTYTATQDVICGGKKLPEKVNASSLWVKKSGKWMTPFHQETPAM